MKFVYLVFRNIALFYLIASLFGGILSFTGGISFQSIFPSALIFGIIVSLLPQILQFFKIKENNGALLMGGILINFAFYFLSSYFLELFEIVNGTVVFGIDSFTMQIDDQTLGLFVISLVSSLLSVLLEMLSKKN